MYKITICLIASTIFLSSGFIHATTDITDAMKLKAEDVIKRCEQSYQNVKLQGQRIDNIKKSTLLSSKSDKIAYKNKEAYKKIFNSRFIELSRFTNEKIKIRTAKTAQKLQDEVNAYNSNCSRFTTGLLNFVEWAVTGQAKEKGYDNIYNEWMKEVK